MEMGKMKEIIGELAYEDIQKAYDPAEQDSKRYTVIRVLASDWEDDEEPRNLLYQDGAKDETEIRKNRADFLAWVKEIGFKVKS